MLCHEMLNPYYGLFQYSTDNSYMLQINPDSAINPVSARQGRPAGCGQAPGLSVCNSLLGFLGQPHHNLEGGGRTANGDPRQHGGSVPSR